MHSKEIIESAHYQVQCLKIVTNANGDVAWIHYRIRSRDPNHNSLIPAVWRSGRINANKTRIFSATYQQWCELLFDEKDGYQFRDPERKDAVKYRPVADEIILLVDQVLFEHYLLKD